MLTIFAESEDSYRQLVQTNFDTTPYAIEYAFVRKDGSQVLGWLAGIWEGISDHTELSVWQRYSLTPKIGPDVGDTALAVGDWNCYGRINERVFFVDEIEVKSAGVPA